MTNWMNFDGDVDEAPQSEGVYLLAERPSDSGIVYVGRADDLRQRLSQHPDPDNPCLGRKNSSYFAYEVTSNSESREQQLIDYHDPVCNRQ